MNKKISTLYLLTLLNQTFLDREIYLDSFLINPKGEEGFKYLLSWGYMFLLNRLEESPTLLKIRVFTKSFNDLVNKYEKNKSPSIRTNISQISKTLYNLSLNLWLAEVEQFKKNLLEMEENKLDEYITFILDHEDNEYKSKNIAYFKYLMQKHLRKTL